MGKVASEGKVKVHFLPTIANKTAPTVAEIAAGTHLTPKLPTTGPSVDWTQNKASIPMLDSGFVAEAVGTEGAAVELTFVRDDVDGSDTLWNLFTRGLRGFILISRFGAPVAGSRVEVYPVEAHRPVPLTPAENEFQQGKVALAVHDEPDTKAIVAA